MDPPPTVLVVAAVEAEIRPLRARLEGAALPFAARLEVTGVGKASAAMATALALRDRPAACVLQVGCAGAFPGRGLAPGDVVIADGEVLGDDGVQAPGGFIDLAGLGLAALDGPGGRIGNMVPASRPRPGTLRSLASRVEGRFAVRMGRLVTVSTGSGTGARAAEIAGRWDALAESMEGAAAALAAWRLATPFFEVRGISNMAGDRDRSAWSIEAACEHAAEVAIHLLELEIGAGAPAGGGPGHG